MLVDSDRTLASFRIYSTMMRAGSLLRRNARALSMATQKQSMIKIVDGAPAGAANGVVLDELTMLKSEFEFVQPAASDLPVAQASDEELKAWMTESLGLREAVADEYAASLVAEGFDSPRAIATASIDDLQKSRIRVGHARAMHALAEQLGGGGGGGGSRGLASGAPRLVPPQLFDYDTIVANLSVADALESVEAAFCKLAEGKVDVPLPMHITIDETENAGPGDCHVKGGYVSGADTWTVKMASVSFYKNAARGLPPGGGVFVVMDAVTGMPAGIFQENRFMTDLRTGAAGGLALKHCAVAKDALGSTKQRPAAATSFERF